MKAKRKEEQEVHEVVWGRQRGMKEFHVHEYLKEEAFHSDETDHKQVSLTLMFPPFLAAP